MAAFNKFNSLVEAMAEGQHNFQADTLKLMLTNTAPAAGNTVTGDIVEIAAGHGYAAGGAAVVETASAQVGGTYKLVANDVVITAAGGTIGPFRYVVFYNATSGKLVAWYDYGSALTLNDGEQITVSLGGAGGVFTLA